MRLAPAEVAAIKAATHLAFGESAVVRLFGSRTDDARRGGDIDLHIEVDPGHDDWRARGRFDDALFARIEEQKVDVVVSVRGAEIGPFEAIAYRDGIVL
ncbi:hypothetical protein IP88_08245 [alpha proteobacterium AAP81b]|nr:hypothetical protein IP88_08245 [alpha proteobacterium AAP81b]